MLGTMAFAKDMGRSLVLVRPTPHGLRPRPRTLRTLHTAQAVAAGFTRASATTSAVVGQADVADGDTPLPFDKVFDLEALQQYALDALPRTQACASRAGRSGALPCSPARAMGRALASPPRCCGHHVV